MHTATTACYQGMWRYRSVSRFPGLTPVETIYRHASAAALELPRRYRTNRDPQPTGQPVSNKMRKEKHRGHPRVYFYCTSSMSYSPSSLVHLLLLQSRYLLQGNWRTRTRSQHGLSRVSRMHQWLQRVRQQQFREQPMACTYASDT